MSKVKTHRSDRIALLQIRNTLYSKPKKILIKVQSTIVQSHFATIEIFECFRVAQSKSELIKMSSPNILLVGFFINTMV